MSLYDLIGTYYGYSTTKIGLDEEKPIAGLAAIMLMPCLRLYGATRTFITNVKTLGNT